MHKAADVNYSELDEERESLVLPHKNWVLRHHKRPITVLKFNRDGDLLFSGSKEPDPAVWRVSTGERLGVYTGHTGAIYSLDVNADSTRVVTGEANGKAITWDVETGKIVYSCDNSVNIKSISFSKDGKKIYMCTDAIMGHKPKIWVYETETGQCIKEYVLSSTATSINTTIDNNIIYTDILGDVYILDKNTFSVLVKKRVHHMQINSCSPSFCGTYFVTGSSDFMSKILDISDGDIKIVREFLSDSPINSAKVSPDNRISFCAGGTNARDVTVTKSKGNFSIKAFDCVTSRQIGYYKLHFGTINVLDVHPSGKSLISGGEDGLINLIRLDDFSFRNAPFSTF